MNSCYGLEIMEAEKLVDRGIVGVAAQLKWANSDICNHRELNTSLLGWVSRRPLNAATLLLVQMAQRGAAAASPPSTNFSSYGMPDDYVVHVCMGMSWIY